MKPIHLNLAAKPFRDYRPVYITLLVGGLLTLLLLANNIQAGYRYLVETEEMRKEIASLEEATRKEKQTAATVRADLAKVDQKTLRARSEFVNERIQERAFSWSAMLDDVEQVLPKNVRLLRLNPQVGPDGAVMLRLDCAAKTSEGMLDLLKALLAHPRFQNSFPQSERLMEPDFEFSINTEYLPRDYDPARAAARKRGRR